MLENIAWNTFQSTGNIEAYIFYRELEQIENSSESEINGNNKIERSCTSRSQI